MTFMEVETAISCHSNTDAKISTTYQSEEKKRSIPNFRTLKVCCHPYLIIFQCKPTIRWNISCVILASQNSRRKRTPCGEANTVVSIQREILRFNLQRSTVECRLISHIIRDNFEIDGKPSKFAVCTTITVFTHTHTNSDSFKKYLQKIRWKLKHFRDGFRSLN